MEQLVAGNTLLDLEKFIPVPLIYKISDIKDISKRQAPYSKVIALPGTEVNNIFFGGLYDFNSDLEIFNPNVKTPAIFSISGDEFINGFLQLKSITRNDKKEITYNVVVYDSVVDFWNNLGKSTLEEIDFTELNHVYAKEDIEASWNNTYDEGYFYPFLFNNELNTKVTDFKPALFKRWLLDKIMADEGLTWSGNLKNDAIFNKEVIQFETPKNVSVSADVAESKSFRASVDADYIFLNAVTPEGFSVQGAIPTIDNETTPPNNDPNNLWNSINKFTAPVNGSYQFRHSDLDINFKVDFDNIGGSGFRNGGYIRFKTRATIKNDLGVIQEDIEINQAIIQNYDIPEGPSGTSGTFSEDVTVPANTILSTSTGNKIFMLAGWTLEIFVDVLTWASAFPQITPTNMDISIKSGFSISSDVLFYAYEDRTPLVFSDFVNKKFEKKKIILDIISRYNCFVYTNPENSNDLVFNIRDEFYRSAPVVDWTDKKDYDTKDKIDLVAELQSKEMLLTYKKGSDATNVGYTNAIGDDNIYGQFKYFFSNDFVKGTKKAESQFVTTPLVRHGKHEDIIVPAIHSREDIKGDRILIVGGIISSTDQWRFEYKDAQGQTQVDFMVGYPYAGHYDNPRVSTLNNNFGGLPFPTFYYTPNSLTQNNRFTVYWENTINQIAKGRLVKSKFNLNSSDVFFVKNNPNTRVFVENTYYYINKISFEGNGALRGLTPVELLTVEDEIIIPNNGSIIYNPGGGGSNNQNRFISDPNQNNQENIINSFDITQEINGTDNVVGSDILSLSITGNNNFVNSLSENVTIVGNNNKVFGSNVTLINSEGVTVRGSNIVVINNIVTVGNLSSVFFGAVDGGRDALVNPETTTNIDKINSELDGVSEFFNVSLWNVVDSDTGETTEITDFFN